MHLKSNNTEFMTYDNANDASDELFELDTKLVKKHQWEGAISFSI